MKLICVGRNYAEHALELGNEIPKEPILFMKPDSAILKKGMDFYIPDFTNDVHYEVEVLVKIDKVGRGIEPEFAKNYYSEIGLGIDFTARDVQEKLKKEGKPWEIAKGFDGAAVIGEFLPKEQFTLEALEFSLEKNQKTVQTGNTKDMLYNIDSLIAYMSTYFLLKKGDIIFTGTPKGVGKVTSGDVLTGFLSGTENFSVRVR